MNDAHVRTVRIEYSGWASEQIQLGRIEQIDDGNPVRRRWRRIGQRIDVAEVQQPLARQAEVPPETEEMAQDGDANADVHLQRRIDCATGMKEGERMSDIQRRQVKLMVAAGVVQDQLDIIAG